MKIVIVLFFLNVFWGDLPAFSWGFFLLAGTYWGKKWGIFFKFISFHFYTYTFYHKADRWGRLVGGKFPMPVYHYNTQFDTGRSPHFFLNLSLNLYHSYLLYMYFAPEMVELLGCDSPISVVKS